MLDEIEWYWCGDWIGVLGISTRLLSGGHDARPVAKDFDSATWIRKQAMPNLWEQLTMPTTLHHEKLVILLNASILGSNPAIANDAVIVPINILSANGSNCDPNFDCWLNFLAIHPSSYIHRKMNRKVKFLLPCRRCQLRGICWKPMDNVHVQSNSLMEVKWGCATRWLHLEWYKWRWSDRIEMDSSRDWWKWASLRAWWKPVEWIDSWGNRALFWKIQETG